MGEPATSSVKDSSFLLLASWGSVLHPRSERDDSEEFGKHLMVSLSRSIANKLMERIPLNAPGNIYQQLYATGGGNSIASSFVNVSAEVSLGSIRFKDGKIEVTSNALLVLLTVAGVLYTGVLHYEDAKRNIALISQDVKALLSSFGKEYGETEDDFCILVNPESILKEITIREQLKWAEGSK